jgi:hypothetical protein
VGRWPDRWTDHYHLERGQDHQRLQEQTKHMSILILAALAYVIYQNHMAAKKLDVLVEDDITIREMMDQDNFISNRD